MKSAKLKILSIKLQIRYLFTFISHLYHSMPSLQHLLSQGTTQEVT